MLMNEKGFDKVFSELANMPSIHVLNKGCTCIEYKNNFIIRRVWDIDTGEVYKHQIIMPVGDDDMVLIVEKCVLNNNKVITYTDDWDNVMSVKG